MSALARCGICGRPPDLECRAHFVAKIRELKAELDALCETNARLNRRCQEMEHDLAKAQRNGWLEARREALAMDQPWSVPAIIARLADATEHLLHVHDCDHLYYESAVAALEAARKLDVVRALAAKGAK